MNWDNLRFFLTVARSGGARSAAISMSVDQATVARRLKMLEKEMGATLFYRRPEGYFLTVEGRKLLPEAEMMEQAVATMLRKTAGADASLSGKVRITTTEVLACQFVLRALESLQESYPDIEVTINASLKLSDMRHGEADIAIRNKRPQEENLIVRHLYTTKVALYASSGYIQRFGKPVSGTAFASHRLVMYNRTDVPKYWEALCGEPIRQAAIAMETDSQALLIQAVRQGFGIGALSCDITAVHEPDLIQVLPECTDVADIWLVVHPDVYGQAKVRVCVDALVDAFNTKHPNLV
ncbi:LysR family transcriptional regulator [Vibrio salinus]|uniref:LysR family transcriptional regulator n=1 Tax=Vibrio salinus TaxID=2899784 RepID=UPI001E33F193|nr:LysR family transcriptional regulator [Vibrio salinus]MCE0495083.1 LysR family transcriptional regulator [Vibrio salinus]